MTTFVVHLPSADRDRLSMFNPRAVELLPTPQLVNLRPDCMTVLMRSTFQTVGRLAKMYPGWHFQALIGR